jgi:Uma2 family endonuclease
VDPRGLPPPRRHRGPSQALGTYPRGDHQQNGHEAAAFEDRAANQRTLFPGNHILPTCSIDVAPEDNPTSEPEPDITILNRPADELTQNPVPADIALIVEVSDSTLDHDLGPKATLYARAGIPEYWVIDVQGQAIHQHRDPQAGTYTQIQTLNADDALSISLFS